MGVVTRAEMEQQLREAEYDKQEMARKMQMIAMENAKLRSKVSNFRAQMQAMINRQARTTRKAAVVLPCSPATTSTSSKPAPASSLLTATTPSPTTPAAIIKIHPSPRPPSLPAAIRAAPFAARALSSHASTAVSRAQPSSAPACSSNATTSPPPFRRAPLVRVPHIRLVQKIRTRRCSQPSSDGAATAPETLSPVAAATSLRSLRETATLR
ncbi:uncharacterized protein LOC131151501 [Malania oleifera]|uniref:uncharacterized protein LOC131151501 n=1 Tax=Malania oleifera TaxID=397392 RepID=UPI0025AE672A|nr:uncharacterized protein LOC131151501 [Malania oleifera]